MIDLHSHILPGLDDGAAAVEDSLAMARAAMSAGIFTMVATPHVDDRFSPEPEEITRLAGVLNIELSRAAVPLAVIAGAEVATSRLAELSTETLGGLTLGAGSSLLVESPYDQSAPFLDDALFDLQVRGFRPVLAHPERCPAFQAEPERLRALVERDVACTVNAGSLAGQFGSSVRRLAIELLSEGLVHAVASDAHDARWRPPALRAGFDAAEEELPGISEQIEWFTETAPAAILRGQSPPRPPAAPPSRRRGWRRLLSRR